MPVRHLPHTHLNTGDRTDREIVGLELSFTSKIYCESCANDFGDFDKREFSDPRLQLFLKWFPRINKWFLLIGSISVYDSNGTGIICSQDCYNIQHYLLS
jgi:hypothetical protein